MPKVRDERHNEYAKWRVPQPQLRAVIAHQRQEADRKEFPQQSCHRLADEQKRMGRGLTSPMLSLPRRSLNAFPKPHGHCESGGFMSSLFLGAAGSLGGAAATRARRKQS